MSNLEKKIRGLTNIGRKISFYIQTNANWNKISYHYLLLDHQNLEVYIIHPRL